MTAWQCLTCGGQVLPDERLFRSWRMCYHCFASPAFHIMVVPCDGYQLRVIELVPGQTN